MTEIPPPWTVLEDALFCRIRELTEDILGNRHPAETIRLAAFLLEVAAYDLARQGCGHGVTRLILTAAELDRLAGDVRTAT